MSGPGLFTPGRMTDKGWEEFDKTIHMKYTNKVFLAEQIFSNREV
jgi:hypothetical protein